MHTIAKTVAVRPFQMGVARPSCCVAHRVIIAAAEANESSTSETDKASSSKEKEDDVPLWVRREQEKKMQEANQDGGLPFGVYLIASALVAIAAIGSCFEFANKNAIFGVVEPDSPLYTPILALFALTGLPTAGWLFFKSIQEANKAAERMDKVDGL